jgi:site-specific recombinase XerD
MGYLKERKDRNGATRYTAYYHDAWGEERSAGTFSNKKVANKAWQDEEASVRKGRIWDPARGRIKFAAYSVKQWLPNHQMEASTRQTYTYILHRYVVPKFEKMAMADILPEHVREWINSLKERGVNPPTIQKCMTVMSAICTTAFDDKVIWLQPCRAVKIPTVEEKMIQVIAPEQFDLIYQALPDADSQLLVETSIETGMRWGELTECRVKDLNFMTRILMVRRAVAEVNPRFHPKGQRFVVTPYTKNKKPRRFKLSDQISEKLKVHTEAQNLGPDDLFFANRDQGTPTPVPSRPNTEELGDTEPDGKGKTYRHGTLSGYSLGLCRDACCRAAMAAYRAERRAANKDAPRKRRVRETDEDGHISNDWFRRRIWYPSVKAAGIGHSVRVHDLRHAHGSWLLAGGADLQVVKERLGHGSIKTTERYLHTLPTADETALNALSKIRSR